MVLLAGSPPRKERKGAKAANLINFTIFEMMWRILGVAAVLVTASEAPAECKFLKG